MNPEVEKRLVADHPEVTSSRGKASFWNFLPPDELNAILTLYTKVTQKTLLISKTLGIEGKRLLTPEDDFAALKEFNHAYEGTKTAVEDMHLKYQALLQATPELDARLKRLPGAIFSGRQHVTKGARGVFFCYALPALDKETGEFTEEAGTTRWYLYDLDREVILEEPSEIAGNIRSKPETPRQCTTEEKILVEIRTKIEKYMKNSYLKRIDAPVGVKAVPQVLDGTQRELSRCPSTTAVHSRAFKRFDQLIAYLRDEMGWPIARDSFDDVDDLFYDFTADELGIDPKTAAKIQSIKRLRPLSPRQPWGIFFVKFEPKKLPIVALRPHSQPGGAQETCLRQQRPADRLGEGMTCSSSPTTAWVTSDKSASPTSRHPVTATTCRPSRCSVGTTATPRCTSTLLP